MSEESNPYQAPQTTAGPTEAHSLVGVSVTTTMIDNLRQTKPWVRFLSVLGFVSIGLIGLVAIVALLGILVSGDFTQVAFLVLPGILYVGALVVYLFATLHLHRYANSLKQLLTEGTTKAMEDALGHQKSFWKLAGFLAIVTLGLMVITMVATVVLGVAFWASSMGSGG